MGNGNSGTGSDGYLVDVAEEHVYPNQDKEYHDAFTRWRNDSGNRFGYRFVHDVREHAYIDGGGYSESSCENAEKESLRRCFGFLGMTMAVYFVLCRIQSLAVRVFFGKNIAEWSPFSERNSQEMTRLPEMILSCGLTVFALAVVILMYAIFVRLPKNVVLPSKKVKGRLLAYILTLSLVFSVLFFVFDTGLTVAAARLGLDVNFYSLKPTSSTACIAVYVVFELLIQPVLTEILFRGCILQLFRQYGDRFAILVSSLAYAFWFHDVTKMLYVFAWSVVHAVITVRSGSIMPTIAVRLMNNTLLILLNTLWADDNSLYAGIFAVIICIAVLTFSLALLFFMRTRFNRPFRIPPDSTSLTGWKKMREVLNSPWSVIWLIITLLSTILSLEFL